MIKDVRITILVDNISNDRIFHKEHGLSLWVEADNHRIVFDTGQSDILCHNAIKCGVDFSTADSLILSHGHYDHTGGVADVLVSNPKIAVFCHPGIFIPRYSQHVDGRLHQIGIGNVTAGALHRRVDTIHWISQPTTITNHIGITGPIPRVVEYENTGGDFFLDTDATRPDSIDDDSAMWITTPKGLVVVTGCCHSGLVNTLMYIQTLTDNKPIYAVIGGFHLLNATQKRLTETCNYLKNSGVKKIIPCHCTGEKAVEYMEKECGGIVEKGHVGAVYNFLRYNGVKVS